MKLSSAEIQDIYSRLSQRCLGHKISPHGMESLKKDMFIEICYLFCGIPNKIQMKLALPLGEECEIVVSKQRVGSFPV